MIAILKRPAVLLLASVAFILAGCDPPAPAPGVSDPVSSAPPVARTLPPEATGARNLKQRQIDFLNRLREADPQQRTIDRALLNEQNELGLILDRSVEMDKIPALMRTMLGQMAKEFPGEDLTVMAYTPSSPPRKIGTAKLDARSRDMTYTPER